MMILIFAKQFYVCNEAYTQYASFSQLDTTRHRYVESPSLSICLHNSRLRIPKRFPNESPCFGRFTSESNPQKFKECWYWIMYEAQYSEVYRRQTRSLLDMVKSVSLYSLETQTLVVRTNIRGLQDERQFPLKKRAINASWFNKMRPLIWTEWPKGRKKSIWCMSTWTWVLLSTNTSLFWLMSTLMEPIPS